MTFDEQDSLIESLNAAYDKAGTIQRTVCQEECNR